LQIYAPPNAADIEKLPKQSPRPRIKKMKRNSPSRPRPKLKIEDLNNNEEARPKSVQNN
jgi:hypothetical protein